MYPSQNTHAGLPVPQMIYGTAWKKEQTAELSEKAFLAGFRAIDTACQPRHYREDGVGIAVKAVANKGIPRTDLFIQTKFTPFGGQDPATAPYDPKSPLREQVAESFRVSQKNLGTDYVDSLVLHSPLDNPKDFMEVWKAMEKIHADGGARMLGISNCYSFPVFKGLFLDAQVKPAVLQNRFYKESDYDHKLRDFCASEKIVYQSFWTLTANPQILAHPAVREMAQKKEKTEAQIFFRFLTQIGIAPLSGTKSDKHMREDLQIFDFVLSEDDLKAVQKLLV